MGALNLASLRYERLIPLASSMTAGSWLALAADLRAEASRYADGRSVKLLDRAEDCEYRADRLVQAAYTRFTDQWIAVGSCVVVDANRRISAQGHYAAMAMLAGKAVRS